MFSIVDLQRPVNDAPFAGGARRHELRHDLLVRRTSASGDRRAAEASAASCNSSSSSKGGRGWSPPTPPHHSGAARPHIAHAPCLGHTRTRSYRRPTRRS
jgi:hypothetical protein